MVLSPGRDATFGGERRGSVVTVVFQEEAEKENGNFMFVILADQERREGLSLLSQVSLFINECDQGHPSSFQMLTSAVHAVIFGHLVALARVDRLSNRHL